MRCKQCLLWKCIAFSPQCQFKCIFKVLLEVKFRMFYIYTQSLFMNIRKLKASPETKWLIGTLRVKLFWYTESSKVIIKRCNINTFTLYVNNWGVTAVNMDYTYLLFLPTFTYAYVFLYQWVHRCIHVWIYLYTICLS